MTPSDVVAAVDIGGTRVKASLVDRSLRVVAQTVAPTPRTIATDLVAVVANSTDALLEQAERNGERPTVVGCGVVVPGVVDEVTGTGVVSVNLGWRDLPIRDPVAAALGVPTAVGHDVRAGLVAEAMVGAAQGATNVLFMPVGTGIAGALMLDGAVVTADGWAGEVGHVMVAPDGLRCPCGAVGCLETVASAAAVGRTYATRSGRTDADAETVSTLAAQGDSLACAVWDEAVSSLAQAIATTVSITGVERVVMGGGLAMSGDTLLVPLQAQVAGRLTFQRIPALVRAALGDRAGSLGAACLAWDAL